MSKSRREPLRSAGRRARPESARFRARSIDERQRLSVCADDNEICASRRSAPSAFAVERERTFVVMRQNSGAKTPREQNYWNKIIAILFSKVQLFAGQTGAGFKTSLFCTHTSGVTAKSRSN